MGKKQPSTIEAVKETNVRLEFLQSYQKELQKSLVGLISGGSMSYGRFLNIRGGENGSDLDLILIYDDLKNICAEDISPQNLGFSAIETEQYKKRIINFQKLAADQTAQILSQKFVLRNFDVSTHLMSLETFKKMMTIPQSKNRDEDIFFFDYKPKKYVHKIIALNDIQGNKHIFEVKEEKLGIRGINDQEVVVTIPTYLIREGLFVPGMYQNLVNPCFEYEFSQSDLIPDLISQFRLNLSNLGNKKEKKGVIFHKSHPRHEIFSSLLFEN